MRAKFFALSLILAATPALASTPTGHPFAVTPDDQLRLAPGQGVRDTAPMPFMERSRNGGTEARPLTGRHRNNLAPPHRDAGGVPSPRI